MTEENYWKSRAAAAAEKAEVGTGSGVGAEVGVGNGVGAGEAGVREASRARMREGAGLKAAVVGEGAELFWSGGVGDIAGKEGAGGVGQGGGAMRGVVSDVGGVGGSRGSAGNCSSTGGVGGAGACARATASVDVGGPVLGLRLATSAGLGGGDGASKKARLG